MYNLLNNKIKIFFSICWQLTNYTNKERKAARTQFFSACYFTGTLLPTDFFVHLAEYKGSKNYEDDDNDSDYKDIYSRDIPSLPASQFLIKDRYTRSEQYLALIQEDPTVTMDTSTAGKTSIKFGKGSVTVSIGTAQIPIEIGKIDFEVLDAPTPFLLCLADMDRLKGNVRIPRERATAFLTEIELRRLYRRFGHPAIMRLARLLKDTNYNNFKERTLNSAPRRFKFTLKDDYYFNYKILVDVMYLRSKPILYIVNLVTFAEFRAKAKIIGVTCKQVPIEAHWSVSKIERYHAPLHRAWDILYAKLASTIAYPRITIELPLLLLIVTDALNTRNRPNTADMLALPL
ncbi:hypothetical protein BU23DRAFT_582436 [Bimuria novae-zelandiae CBS 107.79]|uniref:Uncharacterized protein n=1 Tax=Bimuria novae-zelandiae CBS 107.79 TaxID=1447943 RepID=A0A6A5V1L3_9PLEO|nr:hypothetical protein BU23DRAFT_582436 [Bimuria novae-zelandiae CBS 107.79]